MAEKEPFDSSIESTQPGITTPEKNTVPHTDSNKDEKKSHQVSDAMKEVLTQVAKDIPKEPNDMQNYYITYMRF